MAQRRTRILPITSINPPYVDAETDILDWWNANKDHLPHDQVDHLLESAHALQTSLIPVAFPTETVYGLGADATRSEAVRGIYTAKQRPSDNPLIVHVASLDQLRALLRPPVNNDHPSKLNHTKSIYKSTTTTNNRQDPEEDPVPSIYAPLISRFWPGPLTLLFSLPTPSPFAREVTPVPLTTVGVRMPSSPLARLLIALADRPLAAPSANASSRPSPTTAAHVLNDLDGRIEIILDGGPCVVGVESTVVDGLGEEGRRPAVLRPGGVGIEEIRRLGGAWADVTVGYRDQRQSRMLNGNETIINENQTQIDAEGMNGDIDRPRAPGMKYRHYAPNARVHLFESSSSSTSSSSEDDARAKVISYYTAEPHYPTGSATSTDHPRIGVIATKSWRAGLGFPPSSSSSSSSPSSSTRTSDDSRRRSPPNPTDVVVNSQHQPPPSEIQVSTFHIPDPSLRPNLIYSIRLGPDMEGVARGLFSALRELDGRGCEVIMIEGIGDEEEEGEGQLGLGAAVMNRLRKAADG